MKKNTPKCSFELKSKWKGKCIEINEQENTLIKVYGT